MTSSRPSSRPSGREAGCRWSSTTCAAAATAAAWPCAPRRWTTFARWLAQRHRLGTAVRTVGQVIVGRPGPVRTWRRPAARDRQLLDGVGRHLGGGERLAGDHVRGPHRHPPVLDGGRDGHNTARWQRTTDSYAGRWAQRLTITSYRSGDAKLLPQFDLGERSLPVQAGRSYTLGAWYQSTAQTQYSVYYRTWSGRWAYWMSSPYFPASPGWAHARWATPPVPAGATGLSFGLALFSNGSLTTDSYSLAATPPNVARRITVVSLLAVVAAAGLATAAQVVRRRMPRAKPVPVDGSGSPRRPGAGSGPRTTRPPAGSARRAWSSATGRGCAP